MVGNGAETGNGGIRPVEELSYTEASRELDEIVAFFEQREVDVDQLVARLERATAIVDELDRRLRRTRVQVEELVPRLRAATAPERDRVDLVGEPVEIEIEEDIEEMMVDEAGNEPGSGREPGAPGLF